MRACSHMHYSRYRQFDNFSLIKYFWQGWCEEDHPRDSNGHCVHAVGAENSMDVDNDALPANASIRSSLSSTPPYYTSTWDQSSPPSVMASMLLSPTPPPHSPEPRTPLRTPLLSPEPYDAAPPPSSSTASEAEVYQLLLSGGSSLAQPPSSPPSSLSGHLFIPEVAPPACLMSSRPDRRIGVFIVTSGHNGVERGVFTRR